MSKFGTVYEINLKTRMKNLYPVVYENKDYYICKVHGCTDIKTFLKSSFCYNASISVITYPTFKKNYEDGKYSNWNTKIFVFVKNGEPACFEPFMEMTPEEHRLEILEKILTERKTFLAEQSATLSILKNVLKTPKKK